MRVWVDLTNSPHVVSLTPLVRAMRERGDEVHVTARDFAQTVELAELHGLDARVVGHHGGASRVGKARAAGGRIVALARWARARRFDRALAHGSTDQPIVARMLGVSATTMFDYEFAKLQHSLNCRLAVRTLVPDAIPPERLAGYGARGRRLVRYPGLKEEYALAHFEPDAAVAARYAPNGELLVVLRPPPELALYHRFENTVFDEVLLRLSARASTAIVVLPRTAAQGARLRALGLPGVVIPEHAIDGQSLVAGADLVVSAGGTMNREAVVLGTPVYTTFAGRLGGVDERLIAEGRLRQLVRAEDVLLERREPSVVARVRRDPALLVALALDAQPWL
jgi:predicted glycosyltransferase